jgi:hypothetical protein
MEKWIYAEEIVKSPQQNFGESVCLKDSTAKGWSYDNMAKAIELLATKGYEVKVMNISSEGKLCFVVMQKFKSSNF